MQEYSIILTLEAIYDIADIADYIEKEFGQHRADRFQSDIKKSITKSKPFRHNFSQNPTSLQRIFYT